MRLKGVNTEKFPTLKVPVSPELFKAMKKGRYSWGSAVVEMALDAAIQATEQVGLPVFLNLTCDKNGDIDIS